MYSEEVEQKKKDMEHSLIETDSKFLHNLFHEYRVPALWHCHLFIDIFNKPILCYNETTIHCPLIAHKPSCRILNILN